MRRVILSPRVVLLLAIPLCGCATDPYRAASRDSRFRSSELFGSSQPALTRGFAPARRSTPVDSPEQQAVKKAKYDALVARIARLEQRVDRQRAAKSATSPATPPTRDAENLPDPVWEAKSLTETRTAATHSREMFGFEPTLSASSAQAPPPPRRLSPAIDAVLISGSESTKPVSTQVVRQTQAQLDEEPAEIALAREVALLQAQRESISSHRRENSSKTKTARHAATSIATAPTEIQRLIQRLSGTVPAVKTTVVDAKLQVPPQLPQSPPENQQSPDSPKQWKSAVNSQRREETAVGVGGSIEDVGQSIELAKALFRSGDFVAAEKAFQLIDQDQLTLEDRLPIKYMIASCLRKQGNFDSALKTYKDIAASNADDILVEYARWQIQSIDWRTQTDRKMNQLRQLRNVRAQN